MNNYFIDTFDTAKLAIDSINEELLECLVQECLDVTQKGGKIIATGLGKNVPICEKFIGTLNSLGIDSAFLHTNTAIHGDLGVVKPKDIVILLSKSGNTSESVFLAEHIINRGTKLWVLSFSANSKLKALIPNENYLEMYLKNEGDLWDIVPNNSTTIYLMLLQYLAIRLQKELEIPITAFKNNHPGGGIGEKLKDVSDE